MPVFLIAELFTIFRINSPFWRYCRLCLIKKAQGRCLCQMICRTIYVAVEISTGRNRKSNFLNTHSVRNSLAGKSKFELKNIAGVGSMRPRRFILMYTIWPELMTNF